MVKIDRRILKSQEAIKTALIGLMSEKNFDQITIQDITERANLSRKTFYLHYVDKFDLLNKLIEGHIHELQRTCDAAIEEDLDYIDGFQIWFEFFQENRLFFTTMITSKGAPYFRSRFHEFVIKDMQNELELAEDPDSELKKAIIIEFFGSAFVGLMEWWLKNGLQVPPRVMAEQVGILFEKNL